MPKYLVYGAVTGTKYLGEFAAETAEEAVAAAARDAYCSLCHRCSREVSGPEIQDIFAEKVD